MLQTNLSLHCNFAGSLTIIMNWIQLESPEQLTKIKQQQGYSLIFKHSTRCSISMMAKRRFEMDWAALPENMPLYFLDLIKYRDISHQVAQEFHVHHESPQLLLIKDGECILDQSHGGISVDEAISVLG
ncbi:MAG: ytxJ [Mucilaginibacter sp.]|nr:ytxJ [Mucilaginibacter sp.]MDB5108906.1 ytxJ [Mucilaginibacter sp.]